MNRKHLLLLTLLLSQSAPVWAMENNEEIASSSFITTKGPNDQEIKPNDQEIKDLQNNIQNVVKKVRTTMERHHPEQSVIVLGPTGSGKSTLINLLAGKKFTTKAIIEDGEEKVALNIIDPLPDFSISDNNKVGTTLPSVWIDGNNTAFWDSPGFGDPRGPKADILNAFSIRELVKGKVKILLVSPESHLTSVRSTQFLSLLYEAVQQFPDDNQLAEGLSIVISQQEKVVNPYEYLNKKVLTLKQEDQEFLTPKVRKIIESLVKSPARISLFPRPKSEGNYDPKLDSIKQGIEKAKGSIDPKTNIIVKPAAKIYADILSTKLNNYITESTKNNVNTEIIRFCSSSIRDYLGPIAKLREKFENITKKLRGLSDLVSLEEPNSLSKKPNLFPEKLNEIFDSKITVNDIQETIDHIRFLQNIHETITFNMADWINGLSPAVECVQQLALAPEIQHTNSALSIKGTIVGTSDINLALRNSEQKSINRIDVFGLHTLFIDESLNLPGTSIGLIAPTWKVFGNKTVNLSGKPGSDGKNGIDGKQNGESGTDGQSGAAGENGGYFYGKGKIFQGIENLTINTSGGCGGKGGNGGKGSNGANGKDGDLSKVTSSGDTKYYNDKGTDGQPGGNGGRGGKGGLGGFAGLCAIDGGDGHLKKTTSINGDVGANGNAGRRGQGGVHGRHCQGTFITGQTKEEERQEIDHWETYTDTTASEKNRKAPSLGWNFVPVVGPLIFASKGVDHILNPTKKQSTTMTTTRPVFKTVRVPVPLPDKWEVTQELQPSRGSAAHGKSGEGLNTNSQQQSMKQTSLNKDAVNKQYEEYVQQQSNNSNAKDFIQKF